MTRHVMGVSAWYTFSIRITLSGHSRSCSVNFCGPKITGWHGEVSLDKLLRRTTLSSHSSLFFLIYHSTICDNCFHPSLVAMQHPSGSKQVLNINILLLITTALRCKRNLNGLFTSHRFSGSNRAHGAHINYRRSWNGVSVFNFN